MKCKDILQNRPPRKTIISIHFWNGVFSLYENKVLQLISSGASLERFGERYLLLYSEDHANTVLNERTLLISFLRFKIDLRFFVPFWILAKHTLNFTIMITVKRCRRLQYTVSWPEWALLVTWEKTNKKERNKCCFFSFQTELSISKQLCIESLKDFCFPHLRWGLFTISWSFLCSVHTINHSIFVMDMIVSS